MVSFPMSIGLWGSPKGHLPIFLIPADLNQQMVFTLTHVENHLLRLKLQRLPASMAQPGIFPPESRHFPHHLRAGVLSDFPPIHRHAGFVKTKRVVGVDRLPL